MDRSDRRAQKSKAQYGFASFLPNFSRLPSGAAKSRIRIRGKHESQTPGSTKE